MVRKISLVCLWYALSVSLVVAKSDLEPIKESVHKEIGHKEVIRKDAVHKEEIHKNEIRKEVPIDRREEANVNCIVRTTVREAENQSAAAQTGVMYTIHNRAKLSHRSYCNIVNAKSQFSHRKIKWSASYKRLYDQAKLVMAEQVVDVTHGATFFHDDSLTKNPFRKTKRTIKLDNMVFYKAMNQSDWS